MGFHICLVLLQRYYGIISKNQLIQSLEFLKLSVFVDSFNFFCNIRMD